MRRRNRVLLVGEDDLALAGLARLLGAGDRWSVTGSLEDEPDVVLLDLKDLGEGSLEGLATLSARFPVVALTSSSSPVRQALARGARGVISRSSSGERLVRALDAVLDGLVVLDEDFAAEALRPPPSALDTDESLTPRELEVMELLALGLSNKKIAEQLGVSFHTVKFHVNSILGKLGASSRTEVVALAAKAGLLRL